MDTKEDIAFTPYEWHVQEILRDEMTDWRMGKVVGKLWAFTNICLGVLRQRDEERIKDVGK